MAGPTAAATGLQFLSHVNLIEPVKAPSGTNTRLDGIIVPASRPARHLTTAIDLAIAADCNLVVMCSMQTHLEQVRSFFDAKSFTKGTAVDFSGFDAPLLYFQTSEWARTGLGRIACGARDSDLSTKRNVGLLIARMLRWQRILFIDDDIRGISFDDISRTVSLLGADGAGYRTAGLRVKHFPDNSVVCHARREIGDEQDVFVSGSVLAVDCTGPFDFFPDIYNEDWLFFYRDVASRRLAIPGTHTVQMRQIRYNPFAEPQRAAREEFGDVIAEGIYSLLHHRIFGPHFATKEYWERFIRDRDGILDSITKRLHHAPPELRDEIAKAIRTARETLKSITPHMCVDYLAVWQQDLCQWAELRDNLPEMGSVSDALWELQLHL